MIHAEHVFVTNSQNAIYSLQVQTFIPVYTYPYLPSHWQDPIMFGVCKIREEEMRYIYD